METKIKAVSRLNTSVKVDLQANQAGEILQAWGDSNYTEITRSGKGFTVRNTTATVPVIALPTTTAGLGIWNSAADGGKSIIIDALWATQITVGANFTQNCLIYVQGQTRVVTLTDALTIRKANSNGPSSDSVAVTAAGGAILDAVTGVAIGWNSIGASANSGIDSLVGASIWVEVNGRLIVAPGRQFGLNILSSHTGGSWNMGIMWHEKQITLA